MTTYVRSRRQNTECRRRRTSRFVSWVSAWTTMVTVAFVAHGCSGASLKGKDAGAIGEGGEEGADAGYPPVCGTPGQQCCSGKTCAEGGCCLSGKCVASGSNCSDFMTVCHLGSCEPCGKPNEQCCQKSYCMGGLCREGKCIIHDPCGVIGERCCMGDYCMVGCCSAGRCNTCASCGDIGESCCQATGCHSGCCIEGQCGWERQPCLPDLSDCGNGVLDRGEECDDGNTQSGDCCNRICQIEVDCDCPEPGVACRQRSYCGNGVLTTNEICDDGNTAHGDGCSEDCQSIEDGFACRVPGKPCIAICGDGRIRGRETCDDGNAISGDGCSSYCLIEPQGSCGTVGNPCPQPVCGNGIVEGTEECDCGAGTMAAPDYCFGPNNDHTYGGCTTKCQWGAYCGDGITQNSDGAHEECDMGKANGTMSEMRSCTFGCTLPHFCGDGVVDTDLGEECDLGPDNGQPAKPCDKDCQYPRVGCNPSCRPPVL